MSKAICYSWGIFSKPGSPRISRNQKTKTAYPEREYLVFGKSVGGIQKYKTVIVRGGCTPLNINKGRNYLPDIAALGAVVNGSASPATAGTGGVWLKVDMHARNGAHLLQLAPHAVGVFVEGNLPAHTGAWGFV